MLSPNLPFNEPNWRNLILSPPPGQGIVCGVVQRFVGNYMPIQPKYPEPIPVSTEVWIFAGKIPAYLVPKNMKPRWPIQEAERYPGLVTKIHSDAQGHYSVSLPPGEYTLFARYGEDLYFQMFQRCQYGSCYGSLQLKAGEVAEWYLDNTEEASF